MSLLGFAGNVGVVEKQNWGKTMTREILNKIVNYVGIAGTFILIASLALFLLVGVIGLIYFLITDPLKVLLHPMVMAYGFWMMFVGLLILFIKMSEM